MEKVGAGKGKLGGCLPVPAEQQSVPLLDCRVLAAVLGVVEAVTLAETTGLLAGSCKTASLAVLVLDDPVDARVLADGSVRWVDAETHNNQSQWTENANRLKRGCSPDDLEVLVDTVLVDPVRVEHAEVSALATDTLLSGGTQAALVFEVVDTLADGLAEGGTLGNRLLPVTAADTDAVDDVSLLCLVPQAARLVRARRARSAVNDVQLTVFPAANAQKEAHHIGLLLLVELLNIFVGTHLL